MSYAPIVSLINTFYLLYNRKPDNLVVLLIILCLTSFIEFTTGHLFVLFVIVMENYIQDIKKERKLDKTNDCCIQGNKISFFIAAAVICGIVFIKNIKIKFVLFIVILIIYLMFDYIRNNTTPAMVPLIEEYQHYYLLGTVLPVLVLLWAEHEKTPNVKYIKLFCRK